MTTFFSSWITTSCCLFAKSWAAWVWLTSWNHNSQHEVAIQMSERDASIRVVFFFFFFFFDFLIFQVSTMLERNCSNQTARLASKIRQKLPHVNLQNISLYWAIQNINRLNDRKAYTELMIYFERWTWICTQASIQLIC